MTEIPDSKFEIGDSVRMIGSNALRQGVVLQKSWIVRRWCAHWVYFLIPDHDDKGIEGEESDYEKIEGKK